MNTYSRIKMKLNKILERKKKKNRSLKENLNKV